MLELFEYNSSQVRVIVLDDEPWVVAIDVAGILDYTDVRRMCDLIDNEDKRTENPHKLDSAIFAETFNSNTFRVSLINESGIYACIFNSTKPEAKAFKKWVTSELLPTIRKTGSYSLKPKSALQLAREQVTLLEQIEANEHMIALQGKQIEEYKPLVDFAKQIQFSDDTIDFNSFAKMIGTGRNRLFNKMRELGIVMKHSSLPYQKYIEAGYFEVSEKIIQGQRSDGSDYDYLVSFAMITGKGQLWLYNKLQTNPVITSLTPSEIA